MRLKNMTSFKHLSSTLLSLWLLTLPHQEALVAQALPQNQQIPAPPLPVFITPTTPIPLNSPVRQALEQANAVLNDPRTIREISLNFNNVPIIEYIRYVSRIAQQNFIFDQDELQFNITVVSEDPVSIDDLMATLLQELRIRDLLVLEQGGNLLIYRNPRIKIPARIISGGTEPLSSEKSEIVTRIFELNTLDPAKASEIVKPLLSDDISVEVLRDSNKLIVTDFVGNVNSIAELLNNLDAPNSGIQIGQYVVRNAFVDSLVELATQIIQPITQGNPFTLIPHAASNSIYVVSNDYIVQKAIAILQNLDMNEGRTKVLTLEKLNLEHGPGVSSQGTFKKEEKTRGPAGVLGSQGAPPPRPKENLPPGQATSYPLEGVGGGPKVGTLPGNYPYRGGGELYREGRAPGIPGTYSQNFVSANYPLGEIGSEGQFVAPRIGPDGYPIGPARGGPYPGGAITSQGFYEGPEQYYPYGVLGSEGRPGEYFEREEFLPGEITSAPHWLRELPTGEVEQTLFYFYKLRYRRGDQLEFTLRRIANTMQITGAGNPELISVINSIQWLESTNSLIFTGTASALDKAQELVLALDTPLRQVFIEMLVLEADLNDSLSLGVDWITDFGGGGTNGAQAFQGPAGLLGQAAAKTNLSTVPPTLPFFPTNQLANGGYAGTIIGTHLTHNGTHFATIGALIQAIHANTKINILLNPKIVTEENITAEVYVGSVDRYKTQSIPNDLGTLVTNNYQYLDVGTILRVTPQISDNGIVTLDIIEERTTPNPNLTNAFPTDKNPSDFNLIPVLTKDRTVTKVHVPNGCFVVLSGMINETEARRVLQVPCLGGIPIIGAICKQKADIVSKQNVMLFIRPMILDTDDDLEDLTKRQQDVYCEKSKFRRAWNYEIDETLDQFNIKPADPDEIGCAGCDQ
jgi:type III secretion protein C